MRLTILIAIAALLAIPAAARSVDAEPSLRTAPLTDISAAKKKHKKKSPKEQYMRAAPSK